MQDGVSPCEIAQSVRGNRMHPRRGGQGRWGRRDAQPRLVPWQAAQHPPASLGTPALRVRPQNRPTRCCKASPGPNPGCALRLDWACFGASRGCIGLPLTLSVSEHAYRHAQRGVCCALPECPTRDKPAYPGRLDNLQSAKKERSFYLRAKHVTPTPRKPA